MHDRSSPPSACAAAPRPRHVGPQGRRVHLVEAGEGPGLPVVLLHGASGNLCDWTVSAVFGALARRRRVLAVDRPGFGLSDPAAGRGWRLAEQGEAIRAALLATGVERYVLVGHSFSGALVLDWALRHPGEVAGIAVVAGATMPWGGDLELRYRALAAPVVGPVLARVGPRLLPKDFLARAVERVFSPDRVPQDYVRRARVDLALRPVTVRENARALADLHGQVEANAPRYAGIACPVEILHGEADDVVPAHIHAVPLSQRLPDARLRLLGGRGHMPHHGAPQAVAEAVLRLP